MFFKTKDIPQADKLDKVILAIEAINEGATSENEIAEVIGFTNRQARYYRHAAEILGFINNHQNHAVVTTYGSRLANSTDKKKASLLKEAILKNKLIGSIVDYIEKEKKTVYANEIENLLLNITDNDAHTTIKRRISTIISWLEYVNIIREEDEGYIFNDDLEIYSEDFGEESYPLNYSQEIDIKEERFSVYEVLRKVNDNKIIMNPEFQRNIVWKQYQKSQFIESIILNVPLPPFYFRKELDGKYIIVDGLQRTTTLKEFKHEDLNKRFALTGLSALSHLNGKYFHHLDEELQTRIEDKMLLVHVLQPAVPMIVVYDIFNRINTGGTQLERQEIRNCIFIGHSTSLLKRLSENEVFRSAIDYGISSIRMKDREAILRCLAFEILNLEKEYNNSMDEFLEKAMKRLNRLSENDILILENQFIKTIKITYELFKEKNFRLPTSNSRGKINIAIMESVFNFFLNTNEEFINNNILKIKDNYEFVLLKDEEYLNSVKYSTGSTSKVKTRFLKAYQILSSV